MSNAIDLTGIWAQTTGIYKDAGHIYLRVKTPEMPVSLTSADPWFVTADRLPDGQHWAVVLREKELSQERGPHRSTAAQIVTKAMIADDILKDVGETWLAIRRTYINQGMQSGGNNLAGGP